MEINSVLKNLRNPYVRTWVELFKERKKKSYSLFGVSNDF